MSVDLFFHHGDHVERVTHGVETKNPRQLLETCSEMEVCVKDDDQKRGKYYLPFLGAHFLVTLRTRVHVVAFKHVADSELR